MNEQQPTPAPPSLPFIGYTATQLSKALAAGQSHPDRATRERAAHRVRQWVEVIEGIASGALSIGSRTPVPGTPSWVTVEVVHGGFATGNLVAGGNLSASELKLLATLGQQPQAPSARAAINGYYLSDQGLACMTHAVRMGQYEILLPEEGALPIVAWLITTGRESDAIEILEVIGPFLTSLRFYPSLTTVRRPDEGTLSVQTAGEVASVMRLRQVQQRVVGQKTAITNSRPLYDRLVGLFVETIKGELPSLTVLGGDHPQSQSGEKRFVVQGGWPCQWYPADWKARGSVLLAEIDAHVATLPKRRWTAKDREPFECLISVLRVAVQNPAAVAGRDVGRVRQILAGYITKRGVPGSERWRDSRQADRDLALQPLHSDYAKVLAERLDGYPGNAGVSDLSPLIRPIGAAEADRWHLIVGASMPTYLCRKVHRCWAQPLEVLVRERLVGSAEVLARLVPQISGHVYAMGFDDPIARRLYADVYVAFRKRRSLLLLNLESQVKLHELPWIAALNKHRRAARTDEERAARCLAMVAAMTLEHFPATLIPNKLITEFIALAKQARLELPLVYELAADIFMGAFTGTFLAGSKLAAELLDASLYSRYYGVDYRQIMKLPDPITPDVVHRGASPPVSAEFAALCRQRAMARGDLRGVAGNGMIIEEQQILSTQNLAPLFVRLGLGGGLLRPHLDLMARRCFECACTLLQHPKIKLRNIKNAAYGWRQMLFYLSLQTEAEHRVFLSWAHTHLASQNERLRVAFAPVMYGLELAIGGQTLAAVDEPLPGVRRFLGWTCTRHWALREDQRG